MESGARASLVFHGIVVIVLGLLPGIPYALVIGGDLPGDLRAWRMAHLEGVLNGMLMLVISAAGGSMTLSPGRSRLLVRCFGVAGYGNVAASVLGAIFGVRGLTPTGPASNFVTYVIFMAAVVGVLLGLAIAAQGALRARRGAPAPE
jgi:hypothetical protein